MTACERLDDRAGVHPCTALRAWPADHRVPTVTSCSRSTFPNSFVQICRLFRASEWRGHWFLCAVKQGTDPTGVLTILI